MHLMIMQLGLGFNQIRGIRIVFADHFITQIEAGGRGILQLDSGSEGLLLVCLVSAFLSNELFISSQWVKVVLKQKHFFTENAGH